MEVSLLAGAGGAVFGELLKIVLKATGRCVNFKDTLARLLGTLASLDPVIQEMQQQDTELGRRKEELQSLLSLMGQGKQLVLECSQITRFDLMARVRYETKLQELIQSLQTFITIDLQVKTARDVKEILLNVMKILSKNEKRPCLKAEEDATSHSISTPLLQDVNESEQEDQWELLLSVIENSFTNLSAQSSTNGIDANEVTHEKKEFFRGFLSVTVISAENLHVSDFMRTSDPYVVLTLRKAKSKAETIHKTKVVSNYLDPVWNQTFDFDVEDGLNDVLIVEVWDKGTIKKDDFIGRCTLSLHWVIHEEEYERSFKLLGTELGYLKLHLKWMLQPIDCDSNFLLPLSTSDLELKPVGTLKVKLLQAKELPYEHIIIKSDPFAVLHIQASGDKGKKSETIKNDVNPIWNQNFEFSVEDVSTEHLIVEVYDSRHFRLPKLIGCAKIRLSVLQPGKVKYVWSKLEPLAIQRDNKNRGQVHMELLYCPFGMENSFTNMFAPNYPMEEAHERSANGIEANGNENAVTRRGKEVIISGILTVTVISAENLPALDFMGKSDPFVVLTLRKAKSKEEIKRRTRVMKQNLNPNWMEKFVFVVEDGLHDMVILEVWDMDLFRKDYIGRCILSLTKVILEGEYTESFELVCAKFGSLKLHLKWSR